MTPDQILLIDSFGLLAYRSNIGLKSRDEHTVVQTLSHSRIQANTESHSWRATVWFQPLTHSLKMTHPWESVPNKQRIENRGEKSDRRVPSILKSWLKERRRTPGITTGGPSYRSSVAGCRWPAPTRELHPSALRNNVYPHCLFS